MKKLALIFSTLSVLLVFLMAQVSCGKKSSTDSAATTTTLPTQVSTDVN